MPEIPVIDSAHVAQLVAAALAEDIGDGDRTTIATVPDGAAATALVRQKAPGVVFGLQLAEEAFDQLGARTERRCEQGVWRKDGEVLHIEGEAAQILQAERVALNFLGRLSGVGTLTARYAKECEGTGCRVLDTRKTTPLHRVLEKAAVVAGGGVSHRFGLFDEILIKENHIAAAGSVTAAVTAALERFPQLPLDVECQSAADVADAVGAGAKRLLLDNMDVQEMTAIVDEFGDRAEFEASGNISLERAGSIARAGLDFISVGALTHSAPALDLSLIMEQA